jgi:uncharacterized hydrophobic protein (TIGR00341 family)
MALRLIEMVLPAGEEKLAEELLEEPSTIRLWHETGSGNRVLVKFLVLAEAAEAVLDNLEKRFYGNDSFRIVLLPVEASIPRPEPTEESPPQQEETQPEQDAQAKGERIHREELYEAITDVTKLSKVYMVMVVLSSLVATIGIIRNNIAIIIGAMVIAPLLGPNVALSFATTLGDISLGRKALQACFAGIVAALIVSALLGIVLSFDVSAPEIISRTKVGLGDVTIALAAGTAGALAFATGISSALIGVMVAVALLPPLVTFGLLLGAGQGVMAIGALLLFLTNIICINLAGVVTFLVQGARPLTWGEANKAKKATRRAIAVWFILLLALIGIILFSQKS